MPEARTPAQALHQGKTWGGVLPSLTLCPQSGRAPGMGPTAQSLSILSLKWGQDSLISHPGSKRLLPSGPLSLALSQAPPLPLQESLIFAAIGKAGSSHTQVLHQPQVLHLVPDQHLIKAAWRRGNRVISGLHRQMA